MVHFDQFSTPNKTMISGTLLNSTSAIRKYIQGQKMNFTKEHFTLVSMLKGPSSDVDQEPSLPAFQETLERKDIQ